MSDGTHFRFSLMWREGGRDYAEHLTFLDLGQARRSHGLALEGGWVKGGMADAHVTALRVWRWGRLLDEELAGKADWCVPHRRFDGCKVGESAA